MVVHYPSDTLLEGRCTELSKRRPSRRQHADTFIGRLIRVSGVVEPSARRLPAGARLYVDPRSGWAGRRPSRRQLVALFTTRVEPPVRRLPPTRSLR